MAIDVIQKNIHIKLIQLHSIQQTMQQDMLVLEADQPAREATEPSKKKPEPYSFGYRMTDVERGMFQYRHPLKLKWRHQLNPDDLKKFSISDRSIVSTKSIQDSPNLLAKGKLSNRQMNQIKRRLESDFLAALSATEEQSQTLMEKISDEKFVEAQDQKVKIMSYHDETKDIRRNRTIQLHSFSHEKTVLQPGFGQKQQHFKKQTSEEKNIKWILQQIEQKDKSSFQTVFHSFKTDSKRFLKQFGELEWDQRQKLYYFFEKASWSKGLVDYVKIWYSFLMKQMTYEKPVVFKKYKAEKKNFNFDKAMKEIAKIADRNKDYPEGWDSEKYGYMFEGKKKQLFEAFEKCTREERDNIKKFFKDVSFEAAFYYSIRNFYSEYRKELDAMVVNEPIQELVVFEQSQKEKGMAMLRLKLLSLQNCRSGKDFMKFSLENYKYDNYLNKAFKSLTAKDKKIVLKQIGRVQQLKGSINKYSYGWFDDYRCSFEKIEKEKGFLDTVMSFLPLGKKKAKEYEEDEIPLNRNEMSDEISSRALEPLEEQIPNAQEIFEEEKSKSQSIEMQWRKRLKEMLFAYNNEKPKEKQDHEMILEKVPKKQSGERNKKPEERMEREL